MATIQPIPENCSSTDYTFAALPPVLTTSHIVVPEFEWSEPIKVLKGLKKRGEKQQEVKGSKAWHRGVAAYKKGVDKVGRGIYNLVCKRRVPDAVRRQAEHLVAVADGAAEPTGSSYTEVNEDAPKGAVPGDALKKANRRPRRTNGDWWVEFALEVRAENPNPSDTLEQRRTMHRFGVDLMKARGVRMVDIARVIPLVVEMAYVPVEAEVLCRQLRESPAVRRRLWDSCATYWSWWFGVQPRRTTGA